VRKPSIAFDSNQNTDFPPANKLKMGMVRPIQSPSLAAMLKIIAGNKEQKRKGSEYY
jgi:hypothetical protein